MEAFMARRERATAMRPVAAAVTTTTAPSRVPVTLSDVYTAPTVPTHPAPRNLAPQRRGDHPERTHTHIPAQILPESRRTTEEDMPLSSFGIDHRSNDEFNWILDRNEQLRQQLSEAQAQLRMQRRPAVEASQLELPRSR